MDPVQVCIEDYLNDPSSSPKVYAATLSSLCDPDRVEIFCWNCWARFIDAACDKPESTTEDEQVKRIYRLVELIAAIRNTEPPHASDGEPASCWGGECWKDLPLLGPSMREAWNSDVWGGRPGKELPMARRCTFAAVLTDRAVCDFALYAIWTFRDALEGSKMDSEMPIDHSMPAILAWIEHAGSTLMGREDTYGRPAVGGCAWSGKSGFSRERWEFWRDRLREIQETKHYGEKTTEPAKSAADRLDELLSEAR